MRQSNIELCRIIAIMMVLTVHSSFATFGGPAEWEKPYYGLIVAQSLSVVGVNLFVLISGYFSIKLKTQSVLRLCFCYLFYAIMSSVFAYFNNSFSFRQLLFVSEANWFIAAYIGLMFLSPILNTFVDNSSKKTLETTIVVLLLSELSQVNIHSSSD
ncbi:Acyltransferase family protein [Prevotella sp. ne3005]|uniref:acyltransferase family protein n=1 Tax=Prevotella sp. ne3005 TaxID=1761887 RepID=UPI0008AEAD21|nr:acyltransferase family protein [Prevotella sp. ne3005]SEM53511.1 Acyltransferase family protein [Prevotella sp. ne3005]